MGREKPRFYDQAASFHTKKRQDSKKKQQGKKVLKYLLLVILVVIFIGAVWKVPAIWDKIRKPFKQEQGIFVNKSKINYNLRTNVLLANIKGNKLAEIGLLSIEPGAKTATVLKFSPESLVNTAVGQQTLAQIYSFPGSNKLDALKVVLITNLGYQIDGYLVTHNSASWIELTKGKKIAGNLFGVGFFLNLPGIKSYLDDHLRTNLTLKNTFDLASKISSLPGEKFNLVSFGSGVGLSGADVSRKVGLVLLDSIISSENASIKIINASSQSGLGSVLKTVAANLGINVLSLESAPAQQNSEILVSSRKIGKTVERIENILFTKAKYISGSNNQFDIKITIGEDFGKFFELDLSR